MNRKTAPLLVSLALLPMSAHAQKSIGFFGGVDIASLSYDPSADGVKSSTGFDVGVVGDLGIGETGMLGIRIEPQVVVKGAKEEVNTFELSTVPTALSTYKEKLTYLDIPVLLRAMFGQGQARPYLLAGPVVGFLLSAKENVNGGAYEDIKNDLKSSTLGLRLGGGVSISAGQKAHVFAQAEYDLGLENILKDASSFGTGVTAKNKGVVITGGVTFPFGGVIGH
jgi:hypothetical protein